MLDDELDLKVQVTSVIENATQEIIAIVLTHCDAKKIPAEPLPEWMTTAQLARYWQLVNSNGEPITAGIVK